ncbi:T9SS type A sorting domain-containing protein [Cryomorphaceae bacterium 1068]|nr:T9SS type A sorting domain-containing protein [Cryomorphaceae bacterium 1068]
MKHFFTLILIALSAVATAQVDDRTETNCDGNMRSIYQVGDEGLPLIVASKGFDCSICISQADDVKEFADANEGIVEIWGAMTFLNPSSTPTCGNVAEWNSTHSWGETIFSFADVDEFWFVGGTPRYYVIHPSTREIVYQGSSFSTASTTALGLGTTNTDNAIDDGDFQVYQRNTGLVVKKPATLSGELRIFNIVGQEVFSTILNSETEQSILDFAPSEGVYISSFYSEGLQLSTKFIFKN